MMIRTAASQRNLALLFALTLAGCGQQIFLGKQPPNSQPDGGLPPLSPTAPPVTFTTMSSSGVALSGIWGSGPNDIYAVGVQATILHSTDHGATWAKQNSRVDSMSQLYAVWGSSASDVYVVGDNGAVLHSSDGGVTWTAQAAGYPSALSMVWGSSADDVYVGNDSGLFHSIDRGGTWVPVITPDDVILGADNFGAGTPGYGPGKSGGIWGSGPNDIYVVGSTRDTSVGSVLHSVDRGATWDRHDIVFPNDGASFEYPGVLEAVWGSGPLDVYVAGGDPVGTATEQQIPIQHSIDGGKTWTPANSWKISADGRQMTVLGLWGSQGRLYAATGDNLLIQSANQGLDWSGANDLPDPNVAVMAIWGTSATDVFAVDSAGNIRHGQ